MPIPVNSSFGALLRQFRQRKGLTQKQLAKRVERHVNSISLWERELELPETHGVVLALAAHLDLAEDEQRQLLEARYGTAAVLPREQLPFPRNPYFTGRAELLEHLHQQLQRGKQVALTQAISGLGGIGKTQTALEYAYRYRDHYADVFWLLAETRETLVADVGALASLLQVPAEQDQQKLLAAVKRWLQGHRKWLLILDNLEELTLVRDIVPPVHQGAVVLTTRCEVTEPTAQALLLERLPEEESMLFLLKRTKRVPLEGALEAASVAERQHARAITRLLGGLPLALDQAGAYVLETGCSLAHFLALTEQRQAVVLQRRGERVMDHPLSVTATVLLALDQVRQRDEAAAEWLRWCAFLAPDDIPEELLSQGADWLDPPLRAIAADPVLLDATISLLRRYSLLRRDADRGTLSLHRLVQVVLREELDEARQRQWAERVVRMVSQAFPNPEDHPTWEHCQRLLPHALTCAEHIQTWGFLFPEAAQLLNQAGLYLYERAAYAQALPLFQRALKIDEHAYGPIHPAVATSLNNLASFYWDQAELVLALPLFQRALAIREQALGHDHPEVAFSLNNLALLYRDQGQYELALPLFQRALKIDEQAYGPIHPEVAHNLHNLALLYRDQGQYELALPLFQRALAIFEQTLGPAHPVVATCLDCLARLYHDQGQYELALPLSQRALAIRERAFFPDHPAVAFSLNTLALLYQDQGQYEKAELLSQRALAIREQALGHDHPDVATSLNTLAELYRAQGQYEKAEPLSQRALAIREQALGPEHPEAAESLSSLATLYQSQGRSQEALALYQQALAIFEKALGPTHPTVVISRHRLDELSHALERTGGKADPHRAHSDSL